MEEELRTYLFTPRDLSDYTGQFVVFFSDEENPQVLFSSYIADEAYKFAYKLKAESEREPTVFRVQEDTKEDVSAVLAMRV